MEQLLADVKERLRPGKTHMENVERTQRRINTALDKHDLDAECVVGGSFAKKTHLRGDHDVDLFVRFDQRYNSTELSDLLENALPFEAERIPGSRDYYRAERYKLTFEIVPVLAVDNYEEAVNVTDMSPLHVDYVTERLGDKNDEVRLTKQFLKANKLYGAESYIRGFSGHVVDLLTLYYESFEKLLRAAAEDWGQRVVIDMESHWANPLQELNDSKLESPLVLVDPLQPYRNAAAALSKEKYELFKTRSRLFLDDPSREYFKIRHLDPDELEQQAGDNDLVYFTADPIDAKDDVQGAKLRQVYEYIHRKVRERQWPIIEADWEFTDEHGRFYYIIDPDVPDYVEREGPPLEREDDVKRFTEKHNNTVVKDGKIYARIDRRHTTPKAFIKHVTDHKYVQRRVADITFERWQ